MIEQREPVATVGFIDEYCQVYRPWFADVRNFENFKFLHLGMLSEVPHKSLPAISRLVGLQDGQALHHFLQNGVWNLKQVRATRLWMIQQMIGERKIALCIDETGDAKKGKTTDYVAKQYIGNLGHTANGIVSVNAYAVVDQINYPLLFKVFKPRSRLKAEDEYKTKPDGESGDVISTIRQMGWPYIVAIRSNHAVLVGPGQRIRYNRWRAYDQPLLNRPTQRRYVREIIFGARRWVRYFQITKGATENPQQADSWFIMSNLPGDILRLPGLYTLRTWIEYGFKQVKNELGWADFRLTDYSSIERWWEVVLSAYLLVSLHAEHFKQSGTNPIVTRPFHQHPRWEAGTTWESALNNLRLVLQPYLCWAALELWLEVFAVPGLKRGLFKLMDFMDQFHILPKLKVKAA